jgi:hypothetical protein
MTPQNSALEHESSILKKVKLSIDWKSLLVEFTMRILPPLIAVALSAYGEEAESPLSPVTPGDVEVLKCDIRSTL